MSPLKFKDPQLKKWGLLALSLLIFQGLLTIGGAFYIFATSGPESSDPQYIPTSKPMLDEE